MRIVFISLEFTAGTFSGNGVYATSQVRGVHGPQHAQTPELRRRRGSRPVADKAALAVQVRALAALGHEVLVISAKPADHAAAARREGAQQLFEVGRGLGRPALRLPIRPDEPPAASSQPQPAAPWASSFAAQVPVPSWGRLDASAPWREFAAGAQRPELLQAVERFGPQVALGVDWSSLQVLEALAAHPPLQRLPFVFLNYRVFSRTAAGEELRLIKG